jgi:UDPglucose 6-dehydrogenase
MVNAQQHNKTLNFFDSVYDACEGVNAIIIGTEWNEFRALNFTKIKEKIKDAIIFDLRNIYRSAELEELGFSYYGIGK